MKDLKQVITNYSSRDLEQRKHWYSPTAEAYNKLRPRYPKELIDRVVKVAQLCADSKILEVGCGPATATVAFAQLNCLIVGLEPNPDFCQLAQQNCQSYPNVEIQNTSFEEWMLEAEQFDAVLSATAFHWIPPEVGYPKAAASLREDGYLILLWNKELQPQREVYQRLSEVYQLYAPSLSRYEERETQAEILRGLGQMVIDSGQFKNLVSDQVMSEVTYTVNDYLALLNTYSPYLALDPESREALFEGLRETIEQNYQGRIQLSYLSAFHIAQKDW